jgi:hypothetical protein
MDVKCSCGVDYEGVTLELSSRVMWLVAWQWVPTGLPCSTSDIKAIPAARARYERHGRHYEVVNNAKGNCSHHRANDEDERHPRPICRKTNPGSSASGDEREGAEDPHDGRHSMTRTKDAPVYEVKE